MMPNDVFALCLMAGEGGKLPQPDNDNWDLAPAWQTPAEVIQRIRRMKEEMRQELRADFRLRTDPKHRMYWESLLGLEQCALWKFYGIRSDAQ